MTIEAAIERVMTPYRMIVHLTDEEEQEARERVGRPLQDQGTDERTCWRSRASNI